jgi:hypothetical protein
MIYVLHENSLGEKSPSGRNCTYKITILLAICQRRARIM